MIKKRGDIWVSVIIYTMAAILALVIILGTGMPIIQEMRDKSSAAKISEVFAELDRQITYLAGQGEGSQTAVSLDVREGQIFFSDGKIIWELETDSRIASPRTSTEFGNLIIATNANVRTYEDNDSFVMESRIRDDVFLVKFNKIGSESSITAYNTSDIIRYISYKGDKMEGIFNFSLNRNASSASGVGYTKMFPAGNNSHLGSAKVVAHMNSDFGIYDIEFILGSYSDFLMIRVKNFVPK